MIPNIGNASQKKLVDDEGVEPSFTESESIVLPLNESPVNISHQDANYQTHLPNWFECCLMLGLDYFVSYIQIYEKKIINPNLFS